MRASETLNQGFPRAKGKVIIQVEITNSRLEAGVFVYYTNSTIVKLV